MKSLIYVLVLILIINSSYILLNSDRTTYYSAISSQSEESIDREITKLDNAKKSSVNNAYLGAMLMKKAGFLKGVNNKVKTFKKGAGLLEGEIRIIRDNVEYRFLRLIIQEHAPKILKYNKNLEEDKKVVLTGYEKLDPDLQKIIKNYSASSGVIKKEDLK
ncbi:hypothetical protein [Dyadobacter sp. NIV53]|uniref:hypothetical protein n=1 Tax=Dyadobacter sp. NIV53 TaxID=2861765 RepID=UPI001C8770FD|nr:hypothetical protein [Dyadobacter sp. NIV53]